VVIILVILIVAIVTFILLYHKPQKNDFDIDTIGTCNLDSDCSLQYDTSGNAYTSICTIVGNATSGTCSPYCVVDSDCWYGRSTGSSQCVTISSKSVCRAKTCSADGDCAGDESCATIQNTTQKVCLKVGYTPNNNNPIPCKANSTCFGNSNLVCLAPYPTVSINCCTNSNCPSGFTCSGSSQGCTDNKNCGTNCGTCQASNLVAGYCSEYSTVSDCPSGNGAYGKCS
jgi:hypothetical protein